MSVGFPKVDVVSVTDPEVLVGERKYYCAVKGPQLTSWQTFKANSVSNSNIQITCNPPTRSQIVSRRILLQMKITLTFTGTGNPLLLLGTMDGPRAYPLAQIITSQSMAIANSTVQAGNFNLYWPHLMRYCNQFDSQNREQSTTPSMMDYYQEYGQWLTYGSAKNPLALEGENAVQSTRGGWTYDVPVVNGNGTATVVMTFTEPLYLSPFEWRSGEFAGGLTNIENMSYTAALGDLTRVWSHSAVSGNTLSAVSGVVNSAQLVFQVFTPDPTVSIPRSIAYSYYNIVPYISVQGTVLPAYNASAPTSVNYSSQNIQLNGVPKRLYLYMMQQDQDRTYSSSDAFCRINAVTVVWNSNNYLSSATPQNLYKIAAKNGINMSWSQWNGYTGGLLALDFGTDIGLPPGQAPGSMGKQNLFVTMNVTNIGPAEITPALYMVAVYEGQLSIIDGTVVLNQSSLTPEDVLQAPHIPGISYSSSCSIYGGAVRGGFGFKDITRAIGRATEGVVKGVGKVGETAISNPLVQGIGSAVVGRYLGLDPALTRDIVKAAVEGPPEPRAPRRGKGGAAKRRPASRKMRGAGFEEAAEVADQLSKGGEPDPLSRYLAAQ